MTDLKLKYRGHWLSAKIYERTGFEWSLLEGWYELLLLPFSYHEKEVKQWREQNSARLLPLRSERGLVTGWRVLFHFAFLSIVTSLSSHFCFWIFCHWLLNHKSHWLTHLINWSKHHSVEYWASFIKRVWTDSAQRLSNNSQLGNFFNIVLNNSLGM